MPRLQIASKYVRERVRFYQNQPIGELLMPTLELETIRCEIDGHLAQLRLNRPEALNAANWAWVRDLVTTTEYLAQSAETRVVIVSGEGRAFCSGLDTKELAQGNLTPSWFATWERGEIGRAHV